MKIIIPLKYLKKLTMIFMNRKLLTWSDNWVITQAGEGTVSDLLITDTKLYVGTDSLSIKLNKW